MKKDYPNIKVTVVFQNPEDFHNQPDALKDLTLAKNMLEKIGIMVDKR